MEKNKTLKPGGDVSLSSVEGKVSYIGDHGYDYEGKRWVREIWEPGKARAVRGAFGRGV